MRRLSFSSLFGLVAALGLLFAFGCKKPDPITVTAAYVPAGFYLPFLVAEDRKLFEARGYRLVLTRFNSNSDMINAFLNRQLDTTAQGAFTIFPLSVSQPNSVKFLYGQYCRSYHLVVPKDGAVRSVADLKGKTIGPWQSPTAEAGRKILLAKAGVPPEECRIVRFGVDQVASQLLNGTVDAIFHFDIPVENLIQTGKFQYLKKSALDDVLPPTDGQATPVFNGGGLIHPDLPAKDPNKARVIREVLEESVRFIRQNPAEARKILGKLLGAPDAVAQGAVLDEFGLIDDRLLASADRTWDLCHEYGIVSRKERNIRDLFLNAAPAK